MGSLDGISSSTPPNGLNRSCIAVPSFLVGTTSSSRDVCRMARASCSMERPFSAARMHSRLCNSSSRLRIVRLVTTKPLNSIAREYCMITQQSLWLPGLNVERPGAFKSVVPGTDADPHASILKALRGGRFDGWISVEEASGNGLDGLAAGFGHADAVRQSVVQDMVQRIVLLPYDSVLLLRANTFGGR